MTYARFELVRTFRNRRFFIFSFGFPLVLYFLIAAPNRHETDLGGTGISAPVYFMVSLAAFGTMNAVLALGGARIATERTAGWNRQLRLTPLSTRSYFRVEAADRVRRRALVTIALLYIAGAVLGVRLAAAELGGDDGAPALGLLPFAALGILLGHLLTRRLDRAGDRRHDRAARRSWAASGSRSPAAHCTTIAQAAALVLARAGRPRRRCGGAAGACSAGWSSRPGACGAGLLAARAYRRDTERPAV